MDADVLYHERIMGELMQGSQAVNRILIDRDFEDGAEPVKVCVRDGVPLELRKQPDAHLTYDTIGESVGFFRFSEADARFEVADITGIPWIEIDFPADVQRAEQEILPRL